jgi:hypothetical protein
MFTPLDDLLIERFFQPATDAIFRRMGTNHGTTACFCIDIASLSWIVSRTSGLSNAVAAWDVSAAFLDLSLLLLGLVALISLRMLFRRAKAKQGNPLRWLMQPHRAIVLLMLVAQTVQLQDPRLVDAADIAMLVFAASALYLGACTQRPPIRRGWPVLVPASESRVN